MCKEMIHIVHSCIKGDWNLKNVKPIKKNRFSFAKSKDTVDQQVFVRVQRELRDVRGAVEEESVEFDNLINDYENLRKD